MSTPAHINVPHIHNPPVQSQPASLPSPFPRLFLPTCRLVISRRSEKTGEVVGNFLPCRETPPDSSAPSRCGGKAGLPYSLANAKADQEVPLRLPCVPG